MLKYARLPFQVLALASSAKSFRDNPVIGNPGFNAAGLHVLRVRTAYRMAEWRRRRLADLIDPDDVVAFQRDGFVLKHDFLPKDAFAVLREEVLTTRSPARDMVQGDTVTRRIALDRAALRRMPAARALVEDPRWLGLVRYVGSSALQPLTYVQTIFSQFHAAAPDPQTQLHADTFHPTVKAWLFLTDVAADEGPFVYVPGSHRPTARRLAWERTMSVRAAEGDDFLSSRGSFRISPQDVARLGLAPCSFAVPANTLIVADTMGFHARGASLRPNTRIEIWAYGRRNPFLPWTGFDLAGAPLIKGQAVPIFWGAMDLAERLSLRHNHWRPVGSVTPGALPERSGA